MERVKERWDQKYPEYQGAGWQKLRDNAARFKKEVEIQNLIPVRLRDEIQQEGPQGEDVRHGKIPQEENQEAVVTEDEQIPENHL